MKIKRFKLRDGTTKEDIIKAGAKKGGTWVDQKAKYYIAKHFTIKPNYNDFSISIAFREKIRDWDDYNLVTVFDEEVLQPYAPFYDCLNNGGKYKMTSVLEGCIDFYNSYMESLNFLEEIKE